MYMAGQLNLRKDYLLGKFGLFEHRLVNLKKNIFKKAKITKNGVEWKIKIIYFFGGYIEK